jgi:hypothetical protein
METNGISDAVPFFKASNILEKKLRSNLIGI